MHEDMIKKKMLDRTTMHTIYSQCML